MCWASGRIAQRRHRTNPESSRKAPPECAFLRSFISSRCSLSYLTLRLFLSSRGLLLHARPAGQDFGKSSSSLRSLLPPSCTYGGSELLIGSRQRLISESHIDSLHAYPHFTNPGSR